MLRLCRLIKEALTCANKNRGRTTTRDGKVGSVSVPGPDGSPGVVSSPVLFRFGERKGLMSGSIHDKGDGRYGKGRAETDRLRMSQLEVQSRFCSGRGPSGRTEDVLKDLLP